MKKQVLSFGIAILLVLIAKVTFSQKWEKTQPNILYATDKNGDTTNVKVGIRTAHPKYSLDVKGKIFTDTLQVVKAIEIGNSVWLIGGTNEIYTDAAAPFHLFMQCGNGSYPNNPNHTIINGYNAIGNVGIGTAVGNLPAYKLDVNNGDINVNPLPNGTNGYRIGGNYVLRHNGIVSSIYIGVNAGNGTSTAVNNTFVGNLAGNNNTTGYSNAFFGWRAGNTNTTGILNVFIGTDAGQLNTSGRNNAFCGYAAGQNNTIGWGNSFFGSAAGNYNTIGINNTTIGDGAGYKNTTGSYNSFLGFFAGFNNATGSSNTYLGYKADGTANNLTNATAIGANANVVANNNMILGVNNVRVGIGLSGNTTPPGNNLVINATDATGNIIPNTSGLQFRQLTSSFIPFVNSTKFLTVDVSGNVILANGVGGTGNVVACSGANINQLSKWTSSTDLCNSIIYDNGTYVGIGAGFTNPISLLHVDAMGLASGEVFRTDCPTGLNTWWRLQRNATEMGNIFSRAVGGNLIDLDNFSIQSTQKDITFHTQPLSSGIGQERMRIVGVNRILFLSNSVTTYPVTAGNVGIGNSSPLSKLQVGEDVSPSGTGYRDWMQTGTLYNRNTDNMYIGLRHVDFDINEAIINWGNNPIGGWLNNADRLRFVFTAATASNLPASDMNGLEAGRIISNGTWVRWGIGDFETPVEDPRNTMDVQGNAVIGSPYAGNINTSAPLNGMLVHGFTGMGMLFTNALVPKRQTDIQDDGGTILNGRPQLRLTQTLDPIITGGTYTDFQTTGINNTYNPASMGVGGHLLINPRDKGAMRVVAINMENGTTPANLDLSLDVNGQQNIRTVLPADDNLTQVLVWDQANEGRIRWKNISTTGTGFGLCPNLTSLTTSSAGINLNNNNFYFEGNYNGLITNDVIIGNDCNYTPQAKLDVFQKSGTDMSIGTKILNDDGDGIGLIVNTSHSPYSIVVPPGLYEGTQLSHCVFIGRDILANGITGHNDVVALLRVGNDADQTYSENYGGGGWVTLSDSSYKTNVSIIPNALEKVRKLRGVSFNWITTGGADIGFIAQEVDTVFPTLVKTDSTGLKALDYGKLVPVTVEAIKQLDSTISAPPAAPILISPADGAVIDGKTATFTWYSVSHGVVLYNAQIAKDNSFSNIVLDQSGIIDTTFSSSFCDTISTTYYWRINAKNNAGTGAWSQVFSFTDTTLCKHIVPDTSRTRPVTAVAFYSTSDSSFKTNIAPVTNAMYKVSQLNGVYYDWLHTNPYYDFDSTRQIGFNAQDVQSVVPEVVHTDTNGYLTLDYGRLVPVLVEAIKEQQDTINNLKNIIASYESRFISIENMLSQCCTQTKSAQTDVNATIKISTDATMGKTTELYQNRPNPFNVKTTFAYTLGEGGNVELIIEDSYGRLITTLVNQKQIPGDYSIDWNAENINSGIYFYSLKVNGIILVKKAIKY